MEDLPSGTNMLDMLADLLSRIYKAGKTGDVDGNTEVVVPDDFTTVEFIIFKYLVCLSESLGMDRDNFTVSFLVVARPSLRIGGEAVSVVAKSRTDIRKDNKLIEAKAKENLVDLTHDATTDAEQYKTTQLSNIVTQKSITLKLQCVMEMKLFMSPEDYAADMQNIYAQIKEEELKGLKETVEYQQRQQKRITDAAEATMFKTPVSKKLKMESGRSEEKNDEIFVEQEERIRSRRNAGGRYFWYYY